jgi:hypothetical protein
MTDRQIKHTINVLLSAAKAHKQSSSMHRKQGKACLQEVDNLKLLLSTKGTDDGHSQ